jgi:hypothetical protein
VDLKFWMAEVGEETWIPVGKVVKLQTAIDCMHVFVFGCNVSTMTLLCIFIPVLLSYRVRTCLFCLYT